MQMYLAYSLKIKCFKYPPFAASHILVLYSTICMTGAKICSFKKRKEKDITEKPYK